MTVRQLLTHPAIRAAQTALNIGFIVGFLWMLTEGRHAGTYFMLAFLAMTVLNVTASNVRRANGS